MYATRYPNLGQNCGSAQHETIRQASFDPNLMSIIQEQDKIFLENNRVTGWFDLHFILHRMGVVLIDNKNPFDFKDLLAFGMFILALLTFVFTFCR